MGKTVFRTTAKKGEPASLAEFDKGEVIFAEGDPGDEMFIIQTGRVEVIKQIGGDESRLAVLEKGDFFGEMAILEGLPRIATIRAIDKTSVLSVSSSTFDQMLKDNPEIPVRMMRKMSTRVRLLETEMDRIAREAPRPRIGSGSAPRVGRAAGPSSLARLLSQDGATEFYLSAGSETTVGRKDPVTGIDPDIDLTEVDTQRTTSRAHAKIYHRGRKFFLREEIGTSNGTFVNDTRLETGVPVALQEGDLLGFGLVRLIFHPGN